MKNPFDHPPDPFLARKEPSTEGGKFVFGGHPQTPAKRASPLLRGAPSGLPFFSSLLVITAVLFLDQQDNML